MRAGAMVCENSQLHAAVEAVVSTRKGGVAHLRRELLTECSLLVPCRERETQNSEKCH
jgi:hypothetical protein